VTRIQNRRRGTLVEDEAGCPRTRMCGQLGICLQQTSRDHFENREKDHLLQKILFTNIQRKENRHSFHVRVHPIVLLSCTLSFYCLVLSMRVMTISLFYFSFYDVDGSSSCDPIFISRTQIVFVHVYYVLNMLQNSLADE
jgi:hypothetical protein